MTTTDPPDPTTVYTLVDLKTWTFGGTPLAVLGHPVAHSISPFMHNAAFARMAEQDADFTRWKYFRFDIDPQDLSHALTLLHAKGFRGVNLTLPHKVQAIPLVAGLEPVARRMGAVNTLHWQPQGYYGYNSDGYGLVQGLQFELEVDLRGATVILLGAGGAGRAAAVQCLESGCRQLWIGNRSAARLTALLSLLRSDKALDRVKGFDLAHLPEGLPPTGILINATSLGLKATDPAPISLDCFDSSLKVYDMIYTPPETTLLKVAKARGMARGNGLSMLVWQGVRALQIWSETDVPVAVMMEAAGKALFSLEDRSAVHLL